MNQFLALSVVLTLVSGLNAAWMCGPSCGADTAATACEHQPFSTSARLAPSAHCSSVDVLPATVAREDARRAVATPMALPQTLAPVVGHRVLQPRLSSRTFTPPPHPVIPLRV